MQEDMLNPRSRDGIINTEKKWQALMDNLPDPVARFDRNLRFVFANNTFFSMLKLNENEVYGKNNLEIGMPPEVAIPWMNLLQKVFLTGKADHIISNYVIDARPVYIAAKVVPEFAEDGSVDTVLAIGRDFTDQKASEEKIQQLSNALIVRDHGMAMLNSELKTFTSIAVNNYKDTLRNLYTSLEYVASHDARNFSDTGKANIRRAQASIQKLQLLTDDLISYAQLNMLNTEAVPVNLENIMKKVMQDLESKITSANAHIELNPLPVINGYPSLMTLLFYHLLDNGIKFRKQDTQPVIHVKYTRADELNVELPALKNIPYAIVSVSDNGIGFDKVHVERIFEMFYRVHEKGTYKGSGIGLGTCRKIMSLHDGFITADSTPGEGSIFYCYFPLGEK